MRHAQRLTLVLALTAFAAALALAPAGRPAAGGQDVEPVPIVFVHGFVGSGAQYQSQAMRFAGNGIPSEYVRVFEYNSLNPADEIVQPALDGFIDALLDELDAEHVFVAGHSLGTRVMQDYLNSAPERAARVAKYVNLDGRSADEPPGGVDTLAIWGAGDPAREIGGDAQNVYFPDQTHTQAVTSPESFATQYEFFFGQPPATTDVVPETDVEIAGRAVVFPENRGIDGATLEVWEVDGLTGRRTAEAPLATYLLDDVGTFGPLAVAQGQHVEFLILRPTSEVEHHIYMQAFTRSNYLLRLLSVEPDSAIAENIEGSERHTTVTAIRYKEWWGDDPAGNNDTLEVNGTDVINAATSPRSNQTIGIHILDRGSDGVSDLSQPDAFFGALPFQTGVDLFIPAAPPEGAICLANAPRGDTTSMQVINVPNLPSSENRISVEFTDYVRDGDPPCGAAAPAPEPEPTVVVEPPATGDGTPSPAGRTSVAGAGALALAALALAAAGLWRRRIAR